VVAIKNKIIKAAAGLFVFFILDIWIFSALSATAVGVESQYYWQNPISVIGDFFAAILGFSEPTNPEVYNLWKVINIGLFILAIAIAIKLLSNKMPQFKSDMLGSAKWLSILEAKKIFNFSMSPGILFGKAAGMPVVLPPSAGGNRNVAVLGPPGTGKSRAYVRNNLFQAVKSGWSVVVTDPKGELTRDFKTYFEENDYIVKVFNLVEMSHSDRWNPLSEVTTDIDAQTFCEVVIANTAVGGRKSGDPFWDRVETNLLKALVLYVVKELPPEEQNMGALYRILASGESKYLDSIFAALPADHPAKLPFNIYRETSDQVRSGAIIGLGTRLQVFQNLLVRSLTEQTDISMTMPGMKKCAYFCIISDMDRTFDFLASLLFSFLFINLTRLADRNGGELDVPNNFLLDEFCNIGQIPDFPKKISTMRGRGIACSVIFQSLGQLKNFYPHEEWETIMADCDSWLILGVKDVTTSKYISEHLGKGTIETKQKSHKVGEIDLGSERASFQQRNLLNPDEIARMPKNQAILSAFGLYPMKIQKLDYTKHPSAKLLKPAPINEYVPAWKKEIEEIEKIEDDLVFKVPDKYSDYPEPEIQKDIKQTPQQISEQPKKQTDTFWGDVPL